MKLYPNAKKEKTELFNFPIYLISTVNPEADVHTCSAKFFWNSLQISHKSLCNGVLLYSKFLMKCLGKKTFFLQYTFKECFHPSTVLYH